MSNNQIVKDDKAKVRNWLSSDALKMQVSQALPNICTPERFLRVLTTSIQRTPKLLDCSRESLFQAFMTCASLGVEPDGRRAHLIPYGNTCQLIVDYKGLVELVRRAGVKSIFAECVRENDEFTWENGDVTHRINFREPRGKAYAYYARVVLPSGEVQTAVMTKDEVESVRKRSRAGNSGPWVDFYDEMAKKTVFRRLTKWLPLSADVKEAIDKMDEAEFSDKPAPKTATSVLDSVLEVPADGEVVEDEAEEKPAKRTKKGELDIEVPANKNKDILPD